MDNYTLYMHIVPNKKVYIGITSKSVSIRWRKGGSGYKRHKFFWNAIQKYGWDNIQHIVLASNLSKEWACVLEQMLIFEYKSNVQDYGYNLSIGGEFNSGFHYHRTQEFIERIREMNTEHHHSEATKKKLSEINKNRDPAIIEKIKVSLKKTQAERVLKRKNTMAERYPGGLKQSDESNKKRSDALKGRKKSDETKQRMRKPKSPEHIEHMRQAQREAWVRRREKMQEQQLTNIGGR